MSEINWDDNAKAAISEFADWLFSGYAYLAEVDKFLNEKCNTQPKTVSDAYDYYKGNPPFDDDFVLGIAWSNNRILPYCKGSPLANGTNSTCSYIICTREQFEAYAKEQEAKQEGEKWTHENKLGVKCRLITDSPDKHGLVPTLRDCGGYYLQYLSNLKTIKPTLTKAEAWDRLVDEFFTAEELLMHYEVI